MIEFYKSIHTHFAAESHNDFYTAVSGRFSYGEARPRTVYPYATYLGLPSINEDTFSETIDGMSLQINIYSDASSPIEAMEALKACRALFDGANITVTGSRDIVLKREMETPPWKNGDDWVASIEFITLLQKD